MKKLIILRGLPGSGKSTKAKELVVSYVKFGIRSIVICSTDDFFMTPDGYKFEGSKIRIAHEWNQTRARSCIGIGVEVVIIDNTNTTTKEMAPYIKMAEENNYEIEKIIIGEEDLFPGMDASAHHLDDYICRCAKRNTHNVPKDVIEKMARRFER